MEASPSESALLRHSRAWTRVPSISLVFVVLYSVFLSLWLAPIGGVVATYLAFIVMALPGIFVGLALFGWNVREHPESVIFGAPIGLMLSGYLALMSGYMVRWSAW